MTAGKLHLQQKEMLSDGFTADKQINIFVLCKSKYLFQ